MKLYCQFLDKGMFELHLINNTPTVKDLKIALVKAFFDTSCSSIANHTYKTFSPAYLWVLVNGKNVLNHKDNTPLLTFGIQEKTLLKIMIRPSYALGMQGLFQVHPGETVFCALEQSELNQNMDSRRAKL